MTIRGGTPSVTGIAGYRCPECSPVTCQLADARSEVAPRGGRQQAPRRLACHERCQLSMRLHRLPQSRVHELNTGSKRMVPTGVLCPTLSAASWARDSTASDTSTNV